MKSDIEAVIECSKALEQILETRLGATGRGLHEKVTSVANRLEPPAIRNLRFIATIRNKVVHEDKVLTADERERLTTSYLTCSESLNSAAAGLGTATGYAGRGSTVANSRTSAIPSSLWSPSTWLRLGDALFEAAGPVISMLTGICAFFAASYYKASHLIGLPCAVLGLCLGWRFRIHFGRVLLILCCGSAVWLLIRILKVVPFA